MSLRKAVLWVDDDGIGIPEQERERIFEPFYRLDRSRDRATGGFGLGLAISRRALEAQGGTLSSRAIALGRCAFSAVVAGVSQIEALCLRLSGARLTCFKPSSTSTPTASQIGP
jgi:signal transduction histidine kinase